MTQCPKCQSTNVVVTEEVYTRKGRLYYRFLQMVVVIVIFTIGFAIGEFAWGFLAALLGGLIVNVFALINAGKRSHSRTKITCLACQQKTYLS